MVENGDRDRKGARPLPCNESTEESRGPSSLYSARISQSTRRASGSSPVVGSSSTSTFGSETSARATCKPAAHAARERFDEVAFVSSQSWNRSSRGLGSLLAFCERDAKESAVAHELVEHIEVGIERVFLRADAELHARLLWLAVHVEAFYEHLAGGRREKAGDAVDGRGLAGAVGPEQAEAFAGAHLKRNSVHRREAGFVPPPILFA